MRLNKKVKSIVVSLGIVLSLGASVGCSSIINNSQSQDGYQEIDASKTKELVSNQEKTLVIDVRESEKYNDGHLENAINIPFDEFESRIDELKGYEEQNIILICNTGNKSGKASEMLVDNGFEKIYNAQDGMDEYDYEKVTYTNITGKEFEKIISQNDNIMVVDVRDSKDYSKSRIEDAVNIPVDKLEERYKELDEDKEILVYCSIGRKSAEVCNTLKEKGYNKVYNVVDGVSEYAFKVIK